MTSGDAGTAYRFVIARECNDRGDPGLLCLRAMPAVLFYLLDCHATDVARNDKRRCRAPSLAMTKMGAQYDMVIPADRRP